MTHRHFAPQTHSRHRRCCHRIAPCLTLRAPRLPSKLAVITASTRPNATSIKAMPTVKSNNDDVRRWAITEQGVRATEALHHRLRLSLVALHPKQVIPPNWRVDFIPAKRRDAAWRQAACVPEACSRRQQHRPTAPKQYVKSNSGSPQRCQQRNVTAEAKINGRRQHQRR